MDQPAHAVSSSTSVLRIYLASQTQSRSRVTSIRSIGYPPSFPPSFSVVPSAPATSLYLILSRSHSLRFTSCSPIVPGWTLEKFLISDIKASLCWQSIVTFNNYHNLILSKCLVSQHSSRAFASSRRSQLPFLLGWPSARRWLCHLRRLPLQQLQPRQHHRLVD
jgi:hypothetical protein